VSQSRSKAIIDLGKRLADQLGDDGDLAASWLSHLLAERMTAVEDAEGEQKVAAEDACVRLILELWSKRNSFADHQRPLRDMDAIMQTLESLDADRLDHRYFGSVFRKVYPSSIPEAASQWLKFATEVDTTAKVLIRLALGQAVDAMETDVGDWIDLAAKAAAQEPVEALVIRYVSPGGDDEVDWGERERTKQVERLRGFIDLAEQLAAGLERQVRPGGRKPRPKTKPKPKPKPS